MESIKYFFYFSCQKSKITKNFIKNGKNGLFNTNLNHFQKFKFVLSLSIQKKNLNILIKN